MKKIIIILTTLVILLIISSCCKSDKYYFSDDKRFMYNENDKIVFKSNLGNYDTLIIDKVYQEMRRGIYGDSDCDEYEFIDVVFKRLNSNIAFAAFEYEMGYHFWCSELSEQGSFGFETKDTTILINGKTYNDIYIKLSNDTISSVFLSVFFYGPQDGVIKYTYNTGESYEINNVIESKTK